MSKTLIDILEDIQEEKLMLEVLDIQKNKKDLVGWGIYVPEKEAVVIMGRSDEKDDVQRLLTLRQEHGRTSEILVPLFKPHAGMSISSKER